MFDMKSKLKLLVGILLVSAVFSNAQARKQVSIVGSSTVFPFSTVVAEKVGHNPSTKTPIVESTGSGGGIKLFCNGIGVHTPDIVNTSRRMKPKELKKMSKKWS